MDAYAPPSSPPSTARRNELEHYFDRHAVDAWAALTSDAPVSKVRATVRAGRDAMRATILKSLGPRDGASLRDAGCGTGALSAAAASKGAAVLLKPPTRQLNPTRSACFAWKGLR